MSPFQVKAIVCPSGEMTGLRSQTGASGGADWAAKGAAVGEDAARAKRAVSANAASRAGRTRLIGVSFRTADMGPIIAHFGVRPQLIP